MSGALIFLVGTIAAWVAWFSLGAAIYRAVETLMKPRGFARSRSTNAFVRSAATAAICFLIVTFLPMDSGMKEVGLKLPVVWPILPFAGWGVVFAVCFALFRAYQLLLDRPAVTSAVCFLIITFLPMDSQIKDVAMKLPGLWPILAIARWIVVVAICFALYRDYRLLADRPVSSDDQTLSQQNQIRAWVRQAIAAVVIAKIFFFFFWLNKETVQIIKGSIPFSNSAAIAVVLLGVVAIILMAIAASYAGSRGVAKKIVLHVMLLIGSVVFGLPFFWLVLTSFKEDIDMSSANGLVWIPKVSETVPYRDSQDPYYQTTHEFPIGHGQVRNTTVEADVIERESDGKLKLNVAKPMALEGTTFEADPSTLKEIDRQIPVVKGNYEGTAYVGKVVKEMQDGHRKVLITSPPNLAGQTYLANPSDIQPVRHVGLKLSNYPDSLDYLPPEADYGLTYLKNTLIIVFFSVLGTILSSSIVAYAFSRLKFPGKGVLFTLLLSTMMLPAAVTLLPTFLIFKQLGWIDTLFPLWVPAFFASAFNVFLLRQFFMTIPKELEDASKIDGCTYLKTFWTIMLPQVKPALAVIAIWTFMAVWNDFMRPLVYINSPENMPIAYAVQLYKGDRSGEPGLLMAFATMSMVPVLALFFGAQKYFIEGVTLSGLGGR